MLLPLIEIPELSPNLQALAAVQEMIARREQLRIEVHNLEEATVIDCGIQALGGLEAGIFFSKISLGGLAEVGLTSTDWGEGQWPAVEVFSDHPVRACMASQYAGWPIKYDKLFYMGSGPACAIASRGSLFQMLGYRDTADTAILCLESTKLPTAAVLRHIAETCGCRLKNLYILAAPTASLAGTVQIAARALETALFKLRRLGYDLGKVVSGSGLCPISPVAQSSLAGLGRTNDAISYGATVHCHLLDGDESLAKVVQNVPACTAPEYGKPYTELKKGHDNFFNLSPDQFNPAVMRMSSLESGHSFQAGSIRRDVLARSFGLSPADASEEA